jgi:hypothetical protein
LSLIFKTRHELEILINELDFVINLNEPNLNMHYLPELGSFTAIFAHTNFVHTSYTLTMGVEPMWDGSHTHCECVYNMYTMYVCTNIIFLYGIRIISNYFPEFERIQTCNCERPLIEPTRSNKWLGNLIFIWSSLSHNWSLTITCPNSLKFEQIIWENPNRWTKTNDVGGHLVD